MDAVDLELGARDIVVGIFSWLNESKIGVGNRRGRSIFLSTSHNACSIANRYRCACEAPTSSVFTLVSLEVILSIHVEYDTIIANTDHRELVIQRVRAFSG